MPAIVTHTLEHQHPNPPGLASSLAPFHHVVRDIQSAICSESLEAGRDVFDGERSESGSREQENVPACLPYIHTYTRVHALPAHHLMGSIHKIAWTTKEGSGLGAQQRLTGQALRDEVFPRPLPSGHHNHQATERCCSRTIKTKLPTKNNA